jgi:hypothetical protein
MNKIIEFINYRVSWFVPISITIVGLIFELFLKGYF